MIFSIVERGCNPSEKYVRQIKNHLPQVSVGKKQYMCCIFDPSRTGVQKEIPETTT